MIAYVMPLKVALAALLACCALASPSQAETPFDPMAAAAAGGRAAAEALRLKPGTSLLSGNMLDTVLPGATSTPPEVVITGSSIEDAAAMKAAGSSVEAEVLDVETRAAATNARPMKAAKAMIPRADAAVTGADQTAGGLFAAAGSDSGACTAQGLAQAGTIERSCQRVVATTDSTCETHLEVKVVRTSTFECDEGEAGSTCANLTAAPACHETSRACLDLSPDGTCRTSRIDFACENFAGDPGQAVLIATSPPDITETETGSCDTLGTSCAMATPTCSSGPETRIIEGVPITRACWAKEAKTSCAAEGEQSTCGIFETDASCHKIQSDCIVEDSAGTCLQWEERYRCDGTPSPTTPASCDSLSVCAGGYCEDIKPEPATKDLGEAAAWTGVLGTMAQDATRSWSGDIVRVFDGQPASCRVGSFGVLNCCSDSGWGNHVLGECTADELGLKDRAEAGATHYIGSYCAKRFFGCLQVRRVYCTFNSKLARVFTEGLRGLQGRTFGSPRSADCAGATVAELEAADLSKIDLTPAFGDVTAGAAIPGIETIRAFLATRIKG
jgi:hypothetical protein